jgi:hypothetical protein
VLGCGVGQLRAARAGLGQRRIVEPDRDLRCGLRERHAAHGRVRALEARPQRSSATVHLLEPILQRPRGVPPATVRYLRPAGRERGCRALLGVAYQGDGASQALDRLGLARRPFGPAEREQDVRPLLPRRRLLEGAAEQPDRPPRRTRRHRLARGLAKDLHRPRVGVAAGEKQLSGDAIDGGVLFEE